MFVGTFPVWTETFIINQITGLIDRGFEVDIYAAKRNEIESRHAVIDAYSLTERTRYFGFHDTSQLDRLRVALRLLASEQRWRRAKTWRMLIKIIAARDRSAGWTRLAVLSVALRRSGKPAYDVVHCQFGNLGPRVLRLMQIGALKGRKLVTSFRGHDATQARYRASGFYRELFEQGDLFLPVSEKLGEKLISLGCDPGKIRILHSGIDCRKFHFAERHLGPGETVQLVTIARLVEMKGLAYAIDAIAKVVSRGIAVRYTVIGDGELRPVLERQIAESGLSDLVSLVGFVSHEEVTAILGASHILIAPSVTAANGETEGIPNVVKEAMAMGMPVLATFHGGIPELVRDGESGFLVPERDADALARKLEYLIGHPEGWAPMGRAGRARVEEAFDIDTLNDRLVDYYRA